MIPSNEKLPMVGSHNHHVGRVLFEMHHSLEKYPEIEYYVYQLHWMFGSDINVPSTFNILSCRIDLF